MWRSRQAPESGLRLWKTRIAPWHTRPGTVLSGSKSGLKRKIGEWTDKQKERAYEMDTYAFLAMEGAGHIPCGYGGLRGLRPVDKQGEAEAA